MTGVDAHDHGTHLYEDLFAGTEDPLTGSSMGADDPLAGSSVVTELRGMLDAFADRAEPLLRRVSEGSGDTDDAGDADRLPATCHWCPVCAAVAVLRGQRPELAVRAAEHGVALVELLRELAAESHDGGREPQGWTTSGELPDEELGDHPTAPRSGTATGRVQRIVVRRAGGPHPADENRPSGPDPHPPGDDRRGDPASPPAGDEPRVQRIDVRRRGGADDPGDTR